MMNSKRLHIVSVFFIVMMAFCQQTVLAKPSPIPMLEATSNKMIDGLKEKKATLKSNHRVVFNLVHRILLPHVDKNTMSRIVLGRNMWNKASKAQREAFIKQFMTMLIRTYASALEAYDNETINFLPTRIDFSKVDRGLVRSQIIRGGGAPPIDLNYRVVYKGSEWLVYDMSVEGVSIVQSMRSQFANELSQGGMEALLMRMREHNKGY